MEARFIDQDAIQPTEIEHKCEEMYDGDRLEQKYNYIVYHFDLDGVYFWARSYLDEIHTAFVYGPFDSRASMKPIASPLHRDVLAYFKRRFRKLQTLQSEDYKPI